MSRLRSVPFALALVLAAPAQAAEARGLLVVVGLDLGSYGIGSDVSGPSVGGKLGVGYRWDTLAVALVGEADYGIVNLPLRDPKGNWTGSSWLLPQIDVASLDESLRLHAFVGGGWGRFADAAGYRQEVGLYGFGAGLGYGIFDVTLRRLLPLSRLQPGGRAPVAGVGTQFTVGMRFDLTL